MPGISSERILIFTPAGRDAPLTQQVLEQLDLPCHICSNVEELCRSIAEGAGTALIAEAALSPDAVELLARTLEGQEAWSDLPLIVLTPRVTSPQRRRTLEPLRSLGNVTLVERPVGVRTLQGTVRAAIRSRRRQYAARKILEEREALVEQLKETVRFNEMFVAILSHDLRNPLGAIATGAHLLLRQEDNERLHRPLARILRSAERMARMIEQLLDFTRVRVGGGLMLSRSRVSLETLCEQVIEELELANPDRPLSFESRGNTEGEWDADRLAQVLSNLIANALEHGSRDSSVLVEVDGTDDTDVVACVSNQGVIPEAALPTLFDAFRGTQSGSDQRQGLGLGLYIAREIVLAHGGSVRVTSDEALGTRFVVRLPREAILPSIAP